MRNFLAADGAAAGCEGLFTDPLTIVMMVVLVVFVAAMFIWPMFSRKKNSTQANELYANLAPGDKVMTIGGIIGTIVEIEELSPVDKKILIETGAEGQKTTLWLDIKGIYQNISKPPPERPGLFGGKKSDTDVIAPLPNPDSFPNVEAAEEPFADGEVPKEEN
ncbi:MAG: preprotein translocase subunit YajC [Firmicutes bacterium]|nr:preprotein translocase subunit YajC [Bacillota bacterium]